LSDPRETSLDLQSAVSQENRLPDERTKQLFWLALGLVGLLALAFVVLVAYGLEIESSDYTEPLLLIGLLAFVTCTIAYFADKEREQRAENRRLIRQLRDTAKALDTRVARLNKLSETSVHLAGALDVDRISELVVEALVAQVSADAASLVPVDKSKDEYVHRRSMGPLAQIDEDSDDPLSLAMAAAQDGPAIHSVEQSPTVADRLAAWNKVRASISAPMKVSDVVSGALAAIREETFDTEDLNLLTTLASMSSKAIESAELHQQLRQSYFRTLHVLARSLAARDPYSAAHGEAVTWLACRLAEKLDFPPSAVELLESYGPLHDLGKIGIPDAVLLKQGPLTDEELEMIRQHPVIGQNIIQPLNPGADALAMIRSHHERWDGGGYPDGIAGDHIPPLARVVAVADAFHAIVSHRSYRGGAIPLAAVHEIRLMAETQFDPRVAEVLVALWEKGELANFNIRLGQFEDRPDVLDLSHSLAAPQERRR
jgi:response regulator RpfG family c-di-GMP phosphodiesterase